MSAEEITICILSIIGAFTVFYFSVRIEEAALEHLTGAGGFESLCNILKEAVENLKKTKGGGRAA